MLKRLKKYLNNQQHTSEQPSKEVSNRGKPAPVAPHNLGKNGHQGNPNPSTLSPKRLLVSTNPSSLIRQTVAIKAVSEHSIPEQNITETNTHNQQALTLTVKPELTTIASPLEWASFQPSTANSAQVYQQQAQALKHQGKLEDAVVYYRRAIAQRHVEDMIALKASESKTNSRQINNNLFPSLQEPQPAQTSFEEHQLLEVVTVYLQQAQAYSNQQKWQEAISACQDALHHDAHCAQAYKIWGNAHQKMGQMPQAMGCYAKAIELQPDFAEVYVNLGSLYAAQKQWQQAIDYYQKAINFNPKLVAAYRNLAKVWLKLEKPEAALLCRYQALELEPETVSSQEHLELGKQLWEQGKYTQAIACYRRAIKFQPDWVEAYQKLAAALANQGEWQESNTYYRQALDLQGNYSQNAAKTTNSVQLVEANSSSSNQIEAYLQAAKNKPETGELYANLGNLYAQKQQWQQAISSYQQAIKLEPKLVGAYRNLARVFMRIGQQAAALDSWYQALSLEPKFVSAKEHYNLGNALFAKGKGSQAIVCYRRAIDLQPDLVAAYQSLGELLHQQGQHAQAMATYRQAVEQQPQNAQLNYLLAQALAQQEQWQKAVTYYQKAIELQPSLSQAHHELGNVLNTLGRWQEAVIAFGSTIELKPDFSWSYSGLGEALLRLNRWQEAAQTLRQAIALNPHFSWSYYNLGEALVFQGLWEDAFAAYHQAHELEPNLPGIYLRLAEAIRQGVSIDADKAIYYYQQAIIHHPEQVQNYFPLLEQQSQNGELYLPLGEALLAQSRLDGAVVFLQMAKELSPDNPQPYIKLGKALLAQQQFIPALTNLQTAVELQPNAIAYDLIGQALQSNGELEAAIRAYHQALELQPQLAPAHYHLGCALAKLGQFYEAKLSLQQALTLDPNQACAYAELGAILAQQGNYTQAISVYQQSVALQSNWEVQRSLGDILLQLERWEQAVPVYQGAIALNRDVSWLHNGLGDALLKLQRWQEAEQSYRYAIALHGDFPWSHYHLGEALLHQGDWQGAVVAYHQALELDPQLDIVQQRLTAVWQEYSSVPQLSEVVEPPLAEEPSETATVAAFALSQTILLLRISGVELNQDIRLYLDEQLLTKHYYWHSQDFTEQHFLLVSAHQEAGELKFTDEVESVLLTAPLYLSEQLDSVIAPLLPELGESIFSLIETAKIVPELATTSQFSQLLQLLGQSWQRKELNIEQAYWLTPNLIYCEFEANDFWFANPQLLLMGARGYQQGHIHWFQISAEHICVVLLLQEEVSALEQSSCELLLFSPQELSILSGAQCQSAYGLEFIAYLDSKPDYTKCLIRENLSLAVTTHTPVNLRETAGKLLHKLQHFVKVAPLLCNDLSQPFSIFFDEIIPIRANGVFLSGWMSDPYNLIEEMEIICDLGLVLPCIDKLHRVKRPDVTEHLQQTAYGSFAREPGFLAYVQVPDEIRKTWEDFAQLHSFRFRVRLKGDIELNIIPQINYYDLYTARDRILGILPADRVNQSMLEECIGLAASGLHKFCMEQVAVQEVIAIGEPATEPLVSIIMPLCQSLNFLKVQFATLANEPDIEQCELIYVLDSPENLEEVKSLLTDYAYLYNLSVVLVVMHRHSGYAATINSGANYARGNYLLLMHLDVFPKARGWMQKMIDFYTSSDQIATLAPKLLYEDQSIQHAGIFFQETQPEVWTSSYYYKGFPSKYTLAQNSRCVPAVTDACLLIRTDLYQQIGGLSTDYLTIGFEASDLCLQCADLGYENWYFSEVEFYYWETQSTALANKDAQELAHRYETKLHSKKWAEQLKTIAASSTFN